MFWLKYMTDIWHDLAQIHSLKKKSILTAFLINSNSMHQLFRKYWFTERQSFQMLTWFTLQNPKKIIFIYIITNLIKEFLNYRKTVKYTGVDARFPKFWFFSLKFYHGQQILQLFFLNWTDGLHFCENLYQIPKSEQPQTVSHSFNYKWSSMRKATNSVCLSKGRQCYASVGSFIKSIDCKLCL